MRIKFDHDLDGSSLGLLRVVCKYHPGRRCTPIDYGEEDEFDWAITRVADGGAVSFFGMSESLQDRLVERVRLNANIILEEGPNPDDKLDR